jgi:hypothetical protein
MTVSIHSFYDAYMLFADRVKTLDMRGFSDVDSSLISGRLITEWSKEWASQNEAQGKLYYDFVQALAAEDAANEVSDSSSSAQSESNEYGEFNAQDVKAAILNRREFLLNKMAALLKENGLTEESRVLTRYSNEMETDHL